VSSIGKKLKTLRSIDPQWAYRFLKKRAGHQIEFAWARLIGRRHWDANINGTIVRVGFFTPYHQKIAHILHYGVHEAKVLTPWEQECRIHSVIYDVGGMTGIYGLLAAKVNPKATVLIFEPDPINFKHIELNIKLNGLGNCKAVHGAVTDHSGTIDFLVTGTSGSRIGKSEHSESVPAYRLDDFPVPDLIKIDVEGFEHAVIRGATKMLEKKPTMFLEVHNWVEDESGLWQKLKAAGYTATMINTERDGHHYLLK
jgi:FkbM family methyltransferase